MKNVIWEIVGYVGLALLIVGQITIGFNFWVGQTAYLIADAIILVLSHHSSFIGFSTAVLQSEEDMNQGP